MAALDNKLPRGAGSMTRLGTLVWAHRWFALVVLVLLGLAGWQATRWLIGPAIVVDQAKRGTLVESVVASGHVESPFRVEISSQITGTVDEVPVEEGQKVAAGQPLVLLNARELKAAVMQALAEVDQAEARMRQLGELTLPVARQALKQAQATLLNAQQTFDRTAELSRTGFATRVALDSARRDLDVAQTQVRSAQLQVQTAGSGGSDYVTAQTQLNQVRAALDTAKSRLNYATILAPRAGTLISRNVERGAVVQPGGLLFALAPDGETQLVLQIDERNLAKLERGQTAIASADAYPDQKFAATVSFINPGVDIARASVQVKLSVPEPPPYLRQDMTVSVDIETARRDNALVLPARSIHDALSNRPWIMGIRNGRAYQQPVRLGIRGNAQTEILEGMTEGDIAVPATAGILTGNRFRPILP